MNHATSVTIRAFGSCSRGTSAIWLKPSQLLFRAFSTSKAADTPPWLCPRVVPPGFNQLCRSDLRSFPSTVHNQRFIEQHSRFSTSSRLWRLKPYADDEPGLAFRKEPLKIEELVNIFPDIHIGTDAEARRGEDVLSSLDIEDYNRLLRVLHARRIDGTLDVPITDPALLYILESFPNSQEEGLRWLRHAYPIDEDEAILARFSREESPREQESPSILTARGQRLGLLKMQDASPEEYYGPQSGAYYAKLSEKGEKGEDDVFGRSELDNIRAYNEAKAAQEEKEWDERVERSLKEAEQKAAARKAKKAQQAQKSQKNNTALQQQADKDLTVRDGVEVRAPNSFEKWVIQTQERASSDLTLESPEIKNMSLFGRLFPSFLFVLAGLVACFFYSQTWEAPRRSDRMFPNVSLSVATIGGILAINTAIFLMWRFPPARGMLNRYFLVSPAYPYAVSCLGNVFSHWTFNHLFMNMFSLLIFGPALHEEIGRGNFIGIYLAAGLFGSLISLSAFSIRGFLNYTSQGASGCIWGIMSAYLWLHRDDNFSFVFFPKDLKDAFHAPGWMLLAPLVLWDLFNARRKGGIDVVAHQGGLLIGIITSHWWEKEHAHKKKNAQFGFWSRLFGGGSGS